MLLCNNCHLGITLRPNQGAAPIARIEVRCGQVGFADIKASLVTFLGPVCNVEAHHTLFAIFNPALAGALDQ